jgi:TonB family protein
MDELRNDIEKYWKGELSPAEMHALEMKALSDPFLADALEGASQIKPDQFEADVAMLRSQVSNAGKKVVPLYLRIARVAAGVAAVGLVTYLIVLNLQPASEKIAQKTTVEQEKPKVSNTPASRDSVVNEFQGEERKPETAAKPDIPPQSRASQEASVPKEGQIAPVTEEKPSIFEDSDKESVAEDELAPPLIANIELSKETVREAPVASSPSATQDAAIRKMEGYVNDKARPKKVISGTVLDSEEGRALPGVNVTIKGTSTGTMTDEQGRYVISTDSLEAGLLFSFIGYETKELDAGASGNVDVVLEPDIAQLSEVVVVGYGGTRREEGDDTQIIELAEPAGGKRAFKEYMTQNLRYPEQALNNKVEGRVTVQFTIDPTGKMSDFRVLRGLGYGCDEEVIRLIQQGPRWRPSRKNTEAVTDKVKVRMRFSLPKK